MPIQRQRSSLRSLRSDGDWSEWVEMNDWMNPFNRQRMQTQRNLMAQLDEAYMESLLEPWDDILLSRWGLSDTALNHMMDEMETPEMIPDNALEEMMNALENPDEIPDSALANMMEAHEQPLSPAIDGGPWTPFEADHLSPQPSPTFSPLDLQSDASSGRRNDAPAPDEPISRDILNCTNLHECLVSVDTSLAMTLHFLSRVVTQLPTSLTAQSRREFLDLGQEVISLSRRVLEQTSRLRRIASSPDNQ